MFNDHLREKLLLANSCLLTGWDLIPVIDNICVQSITNVNLWGNCANQQALTSLSYSDSLCLEDTLQYSAAQRKY